MMNMMLICVMLCLLKLIGATQNLVLQIFFREPGESGKDLGYRLGLRHPQSSQQLPATFLGGTTQPSSLLFACEDPRTYWYRRLGLKAFIAAVIISTISTLLIEIKRSFLFFSFFFSFTF